ncbi:TonB-dependent receptor [Novosphingobium sp. G106]|uniref:TonB-dependent receptor n=1 Tax=Novosphingobium sp. G106 TaxID=2849500 RepID=UPI001C2CCBE0|nr:TonB-dependent receptor [Novosphingobium sp. G106]MBV1688568.1 TonB-dependent receptor [Novosphingobium sp. G106]
MPKSHLRIATALSTGALLSFATPVFAQSDTAAQANASESGNDIIVTARRSEERLQDVPISITVLNPEQLSQHNIVSTADLGSFVPSLTINSQFGPEKASFVIRGFTQAYHTAPTVGVYFADVAAPRALGPTTSGNGAGVGSMFDLQNVQVLKGPQGTLFGRNTTGGAILLVPQKPTDKLEGYVEGTIGNYNAHRVQAVLNVPLSDTFKVRGGIDYNKADGYLKNHSGIGPSDFANTNYFAARLSIVGNLTPNLENYTVASYSRSNTHGAIQKLATCTDQNGNTATTGLAPVFAPAACAQIARQNARGDGIWDVENNDPNPLELIKQWSVINTTTWSASDNLTIKNIASYQEYYESASFSLWGDNYRVYPGFPLAGAQNPPVGGGLRTIQLQQGYYSWTTAENSFSEELQFQGHSSDNRFTWQAGGYIELAHPLGWNSQLVDIFNNCSDIKANICQPLTLPFQVAPGVFFPVAVGSTSEANTKDTFNDKALYAQATYKLTDQLSLTGGVRYTWDKMTDLAQALNITQQGAYCQNVLLFNKAPAGVTVNSSNVNQYALFTNNPNDCNVTRQISSKRPTWLIDLDYKPTDDILLYLKWARGYRAGSVTSNSVGFETVGPEKLDLYEVGAKTSFRGTVSGYFNIAGFYNDFHNQQITINPTVSAAYQGVIPSNSPNINAGHSRIWGVEVDSSFKLLEGLQLDVGYTYLNTKVLQITVPPAPIFYDNVNPTANVGDPLPLSPKNTVVVTGSYILPLSESVGRLSLSATFTHADANRAESPNSSPLYLVSAQNQLNLNVDWHQVLGNPFDLAFYMTNVTNQGRILFPGSGFQTIGADGGHVNQPRMFGFRLKYRFGD